MITALASGAFLGLSCGLAPGPLLALLLAQTLRHGPREGCKIALTPLVTDAPIIVVALVLAASRSSGPPGGAHPCRGCRRTPYGPITRKYDPSQWLISSR